MAGKIYQPTAREIVGEQVLTVPYLGKMIKGLRSPFAAAMLAGVIGYFLFWPSFKQENQDGVLV